MKRRRKDKLSIWTPGTPTEDTSLFAELNVSPLVSEPTVGPRHSEVVIHLPGLYLVSKGVYPWDEMIPLDEGFYIFRPVTLKEVEIGRYEWRPSKPVRIEEL